MDKKALDQKIEQLKDYFFNQPEALLAFVFGSYAKGLTTVESDFDVAKIILASQKQKMPSTYLEVLLDFSLMAGLPEKEAVEYAQFAKLRNILAHEYLDLRFQQIKKFISEARPFYERLIFFVKSKILEQKYS